MEILVTRKSMLAVAAMAFAVVARIAPLWASEPLDTFNRESSARRHCGKDAVVWLDVPSRSFWIKGQRGYGRSKTGSFTCRRDALRTGNHPVRR